MFLGFHKIHAAVKNNVDTSILPLTKPKNISLETDLFSFFKCIMKTFFIKDKPVLIK